MLVERETKEHAASIIEIGIAKTLKEKRELYHLRYHIYAEEIPYKLVAVDHKNKLLYDVLDDWCTLFYAKIGSKFVGTIRVNIGQAEDFPAEIIETFYMKRFKSFYNNNEAYKFGFVSKGMVSAAYRKYPIFTMLMSKVFETYCDNQIHFGFVNCNFHLLSLHEYYGQRRIGKNIVDRNLGLMASLVALPDDIDYLQKVNSPFYNIALAKGKIQNDRIVEWFYSEFPETRNIINTQLIDEKGFWNILQLRLKSAPNNIIPILAGLSESDSMKFLHRCGIIVQCPKGEFITTRDDASQELIILLSGALYSPESSVISKITPGQYFGNNGLMKRSKHRINVIATADTEVMVFSYHFFLKFRHFFPEIAHKIIMNINQLGI
jgi:hypothetical protein